MLELEVGELLLDMVSGSLAILGSLPFGAIMDEAGEAKEHFMLAVEQLTHTGWISSHCESVSERSIHTHHMRSQQTQCGAGIYLDMTFFTF